jgi:hypothetical protein
MEYRAESSYPCEQTTYQSFLQITPYEFTTIVCCPQYFNDVIKDGELITMEYGYLIEITTHFTTTQEVLMPIQQELDLLQKVVIPSHQVFFPSQQVVIPSQQVFAPQQLLY